MIKKRKNTYGILLLAMCCLFTGVCSVGRTYARDNTDISVYHTVLQAQPVGVTSNCMVGKEDAPLTVLVGAIPLKGASKVSFWIQATDAMQASGQLRWEVDHPDLLKVEMMSGRDSIEKYTDLEVLREVPFTVDMYLTPTAAAADTPREAVKVNVTVAWGNALQGTFQVMLPAVRDESAPPETTPPTEETTPSEPTTPTEETKPSEPTTPTEETNPSDPTTPTGETEPPETTLPPQETEPEETTEPTEPPPTLEVETIGHFQANGRLPVAITLRENAKTLRLGLQTAQAEQSNGEEAPTLEPLPAYTRFSVNEEEGFYMLYSDCILEFANVPAGELPIVLDFTYAQMKVDKTVALVAQAAIGQETLRVTADVVPVEISQPTVSLRGGASQASLGQEAEPAQSPARVINQNTALEFVFPKTWSSCTLDYTVERLTMQEDGQLAYAPVDLDSGGLKAEFRDGEKEQTLTFRIQDRLPPAGTYRVNIRWSYKGVWYNKTQTTFFISYSTGLQEQPGSEEVPKSD